MQQLPIDSKLPDFIQTLQLEDGIETLPIRFRLRWNSRLGAVGEGMWSFYFYKANGEPLVEGIPITTGLDLTTRFGKDELGKGVLVCQHINGLVDVGRNDFSDGKANIYYLTGAEYANLT
jgi:hypothetical protein